MKRRMEDLMDHDDELLRDRQCEALTGIPAATFRWWAHSGKGEGPKSFKLGRRRVWRKSVVLAWIAEQEAKG